MLNQSQILIANGWYTVLVFRDFEKAFDSLDRKANMWRILHHYGIPSKIINMLKISARVENVNFQNL